MKNVTITLPDDVARRARVEAARQDKSLSRFIADLLAKECKSAEATKVALLRELFEGPGWHSTDDALPKREEIYAEREEELLRRYERSGLRDGPEQPAQKGAGSRVARGSRKR